MAGKGMNDEEVATEIKKMTEFIKQEAQEKAREIQVKADEEHNIEKAKIVRQESIAIETAFEKKSKQALVQKKIAYSNHVNKARLKVLQSKEELMDGLYKEAKSRLVEKVKNDSTAYASLIKQLILQACLQLMESEVVVYARQVDLSLVEKSAKEVRKEFESMASFPITITTDSKSFLSETISGGVVVSNSSGKISINNTLDARLELSGEILLPAIRVLLFGESTTRKFYD